MRELPILFSGPMVRAILDGRKTQTRRIVSPEPDVNQHGNLCGHWLSRPLNGLLLPKLQDITLHNPYGQPGDKLKVRERWQYYDWSEDGQPCIRYEADFATLWPEYPEAWSERLKNVWADLSRPENFNIDQAARDRRWRPSIHMPRWASRITLEITGVRVERLNDISEADCWAEGIAEVDGMLEDAAICDLAKRMGRSFEDAAPTFAALWESINGVGSWDANPWVWVVEFRRLIDG